MLAGAQLPTVRPLTCPRPTTKSLLTMKVAELAILFLLIVEKSVAFLPANDRISCGSRILLFSAQDEYTETEIIEMKDLILSLSLEPTDESRQSRIREVFKEAFARPNGMPKRFTDLFDQTLIQVGEELVAHYLGIA